MELNLEGLNLISLAYASLEYRRVHWAERSISHNKIEKGRLVLSENRCAGVGGNLFFYKLTSIEIGIRPSLLFN